jgi:hypothetical protein
VNEVYTPQGSDAVRNGAQLQVHGFISHKVSNLLHCELEKTSMTSFKVVIQQSPEGQKDQGVSLFIQPVPVGS